jgi:hypothetical protein
VLLAMAGCSTFIETGSIVRTPCTHVGVRPTNLTMLDDESDAYGVSFRVRTDWPAACSP